MTKWIKSSTIMILSRIALRMETRFFFEIDTIDLWLQINIGINLGKKKILQGKVQFKISKNTTIASLKKKL
jgi:hypothetical protein